MLGNIVRPLVRKALYNCSPCRGKATWVPKATRSRLLSFWWRCQLWVIRRAAEETKYEVLIWGRTTNKSVITGTMCAVTFSLPKVSLGRSEVISLLSLSVYCVCVVCVWVFVVWGDIIRSYDFVIVLDCSVFFNLALLFTRRGCILKVLDNLNTIWLIHGEDHRCRWCIFNMPQ